jgi:hypothetical protein
LNPPFWVNFPVIYTRKHKAETGKIPSDFNSRLNFRLRTVFLRRSIRSCHHSTGVKRRCVIHFCQTSEDIRQVERCVVRLLLVRKVNFNPSEDGVRVALASKRQ